MSAIADFSVAILDCQVCCRHFIESYVTLASRDRVACPHCGANYLMPSALNGWAATEVRSPRASRRVQRRNSLHVLGQRRHKLQ